MLGYIVRRIALGLFTIWAISVLAFWIGQLPPGDAVDRHIDKIMLAGFSASEIDRDQAEVLRRYLGLDRPMIVRYGLWMFNLMQGDLGLSFQVWGGGESQQRSVKRIVGDRIWTTVALTGFTMVVTWTFAVPVGIYSAVRQHSVGDYFFTFLGFSGLAVPDFLLGLVLMYVAYAYFDQSVGGLFSGDFANEPWNVPKLLDMIGHLWIPAVVLGTSGTASLIRIMRNNLLDELDKPYVVTARARGVQPWRVIVKYPVRVAINPLVSTVG
jgi:peptide/nickel transport system permease protein